MKISFPPRLNRRGMAFTHDVLIAAISYVLALYLRVGDDIADMAMSQISAGTALFTATCAVIFLFSGLYRGIWAFASLPDLKQILRAGSISVIAFTMVAFFVMRLDGVPRTVPLIAWFVLLAGLSGSRLLYRMLRERRVSALWERSGGGRVNILLVGAGDETDLFIRAVASNPQAPFRIVGIVGENAKRVGRHFHGVSVLGTVDDIPAIVERLKTEDRAPSRLVVTRALTRMNATLTATLLEQCTTLGIKLSRLPALTELSNDLSSPQGLRDQPLALEDLLGRPETILNRDAINELITGRRVLVTGSGGSIGSELVRQIAALNPAHLIILDSCEFNLYKIEMEVHESLPLLSTRAYLADVRDVARLTQIFNDEKPELVFHAAAIKHVPIAEFNAREALLTNVVGTRLVADCAAKSGAIAMVMISTDKAVYPTNVMGATKRLAEMYIQSLDLMSPTTRFVTVRFGNVLGSTGSVIPRFQDQLSKGGPITVTHPDITRYFMTVREAVELVLQASALGVQPGDQRGKVMVLDMGQPVKIVDLARQMIRLAGLRPDEDIKITFTGLRPGEKLYEELFSPTEELIPSGADGVQLARAPTVELPQLQQTLANFATLLQAGMTEAAAIARLEELVPEFTRK
ncbi:MAG: nucleoside-diphosphate sugar epimerase/dehydratase [Alphaproteobacteria bacterium]|nr:nucleoside-diphosphate sugar epimerase/dehydratase [Alphaproteobacteria bacterium]